MTNIHHLLDKGNQELVTKRYWDGRFKRYAVTLLPGDYYVAEGEEMIVTILGSCISACIRDRKNGVGGMNHFMLPEDKQGLYTRKNWAQDYDCAAGRYGNVAMESLVNEILSLGGRKENMEAKLFGGGRVTASSSSVGDNNIRFAEEYLALEGIPVVTADVGGSLGRKVYYLPVTNDVFVKKIARIDSETIVSRERRYLCDLKKEDITGDVSFF